MHSIRDLRVLVTGATSGIGRVTAGLLCERGAVVLLHGRDAARVEATVAELQRAGGRAEGLVADLASLAQAARLAKEVAERGDLDVLVNNAGVGFGHDRTHREVSSDGMELRLAVNYLAPFVLTHELLQRGLPRRAVVNLSSIGQEALDFDDLLCERRYDGVSAYRRSKLALILWTLDLAAALPGLGCVALHPGTLLDTGMVRDAGLSPRGPARRGGETTLVAIERALAGTSGRYFDEDREARALPQAYDDAARCRLRELTLSLVEPFVTRPPQGPA
ncbi:MAG: SDR family NAD(P)-dependent oxidoreductase [Polyangia bacterium]